ncbi:MAG: TetR family transcriptional regulator [Stenotrophomonas maltophilia]|nr:MAG: TetR family transcriptional regulator [Stenotrophomonas maltophilia]
MSPRPSDAPQRVIDAAAQMLARVGLNATSIREVTKLAEAPLGSTYHHFPGGKQELLARATHMAGDKVEALLVGLLKGGAVQGLQQFLAMWRERLLRTDFRAGCPVLAAAAEVFARWQGHLVAAFVAEGHDPAAAAGLASLVIASVEGAVAMCRALQDIGPFDQVAAQLLKAAAPP